MKNLDQIVHIRTEELAFPRKLRRMRIATGKAQRVRRFNLVTDQKLLYILKDLSGSMAMQMRDGSKKDTWARGVVLKYALQALAGKTKFYFRDFDETVKQLKKVLSAGDVKGFIEYLKTHPAPENAGTNILNAIKRAVKDIKDAIEAGISSAEIVLISDGSDTSISDPAVVKAALQGIPLHMIMIAEENESLKKVATTYIVIK